MMRSISIPVGEESYCVGRNGTYLIREIMVEWPATDDVAYIRAISREKGVRLHAGIRIGKEDMTRLAWEWIAQIEVGDQTKPCTIMSGGYLLQVHPLTTRMTFHALSEHEWNNAVKFGREHVDEDINPLWHPVVQDTIYKLKAEKGGDGR